MELLTMAARSRVTGASETARAFRELARYVAIPANEASRWALQPMLSAAKAGAPVLTGLLRKSLAIRRDSDSPKLRPRHWIGVRGAARFYAHLVELGNANNGGVGRGFLRAAFEANREGAVKRFGEKIGPALEKRASKLARKVKR